MEIFSLIAKYAILFIGILFIFKKLENKAIKILIKVLIAIYVIQLVISHVV